MPLSSQPPLTAAAQSYLSSVPRSTRREEGQVYTPASLVEFILDLARYVPEHPLETVTALDPACGAGAFLVALVTRLGLRLADQGHDLRESHGREHFLASVEARLFGVDKDSYACELAREAVRDRVRQLCGEEAPAGFFATNVVEDDFLLGDLETLGHTRFELVVGNPPYVATTRLPDDHKDELRARFIVANGRLDLYTLFFERSLRLLAPGARLAFITPNKFLISESSRRLRKLMLTTASLQTIASFRSHRVFDDAATVPCVTVLERSPGASSFSLLECAVSPGGRGPVVIQSQQKVSHPKGGEQPWFLAEPGLLALAQRIQDEHPPLGRLASRISAGIATGRDRIFVLDKDTAAGLEPELRRPAVRGQDLLPYRIEDPQLELIIPYLPTSSGRPTLVRLEDFPRTWAYLQQHQGELETRHCVRTWGKAWYDIHDPWTLDITGLTKILVPDVACFNRFALDAGVRCPLHSAYYVIPNGVEARYLTAVLNSSPVEFLVRLLAPVVKDGFSRYRRQFLVTLPIPEASERTQAEIVAAVDDGQHTAADEMCCRLFQLVPADLRTVREFLERARVVHGTAGNRSTARTPA